MTCRNLLRVHGCQQFDLRVACACARQGIRPALPADLTALKQLLEPLERAGITKARSREQVAAAIPHFTVVERERKARPPPCSTITSSLTLASFTVSSCMLPRSYFAYKEGDVSK